MKTFVFSREDYDTKYYICIEANSKEEAKEKLKEMYEEAQIKHADNLEANIAVFNMRIFTYCKLEDFDLEDNVSYIKNNKVFTFDTPIGCTHFGEDY